MQVSDYSDSNPGCPLSGEKEKTWQTPSCWSQLVQPGFFDEGEAAGGAGTGCGCGRRGCCLHSTEPANQFDLPMLRTAVREHLQRLLFWNTYVNSSSIHRLFFSLRLFFTPGGTDSRCTYGHTWCLGPMCVGSLHTKTLSSTVVDKRARRWNVYPLSKKRVLYAYCILMQPSNAVHECTEQENL